MALPERDDFPEPPPDTCAYDSREADRGFGPRLTRKEQAIEVGIFLSLIVPTMILSYFVTSRDEAGFTVLAVATILRDLALLALVLFFLWRNGEWVQQIGWTSRHVWTELGLGLILFPPLVVLIGLLDAGLRALGFSGPPAGALDSMLPRAPWQFVLAVGLVIIVAITEEFLFRGYLIRRLGSATRSAGWAVVLSAVIFALGHGYQGGAGVITIGVVGLIFALIYLWRGSLFAPVVMHLLQDFTALIVAPWLMRWHG